jgi:hypothetical protein
MAYFKCPRCGTEHRLIEVMHCVDTYAEIRIHTDGTDFEYIGKPEIRRTHGTYERYVCSECSYELPCVENTTDLLEHIENPAAFEEEE